MDDPEDDGLFEEGWLNGHDVYREYDDDIGGGIWYDGYYVLSRDCGDCDHWEACGLLNRVRNEGKCRVR